MSTREHDIVMMHVLRAIGYYYVYLVPFSRNLKKQHIRVWRPIRISSWFSVSESRIPTLSCGVSLSDNILGRFHRTTETTDRL